MAVPMFNLANRLEMEWHQPIRLGDQLTGTLRQTQATHSRDRRGRDIIYIETEGNYHNQRNDLICTSTGTLAWVAKDEQEKKDRESWTIHRYTEEEKKILEEAILGRVRTGNKLWDLEALKPGTPIPDLVHPPLTTGDIACWEAAKGPAYRAGNLGFQDAHANPLITVLNPVTGWRVNRVQSHGDHLLASSRSMPGPFDSGIMRFAWVSVLVTDWMGDWASLKQLRVDVVAPLLYGDAMTTSGTIVKTHEGLDEILVYLKLHANNQRGETISTGEAQVSIPHKALNKPTVSPYELLKTQSQTASPSESAHANIVELSEEHNKRTPQAIAVRDNERSLTYEQLSIHSNQLAHQLIQLGAKKNVAVAVMLPRGSDWIVSMLAICKAGAIYVPIDSAQPESRRNFMIREASTQILITDSALVPMKERDHLEVLYLEESRTDIEGLDKNLPSQTKDPESIAYVMFTSGSTGLPKGAAISNGALAQYLDSLNQALPLQKDDTYLNTATFSFSASIRQCFHPLAAGMTQVIVNDSQQKDSIQLAKLVEETGATIWDTVPSAWYKAMARLQASHSQNSEKNSLSSIRRILLTGEALPWRHPRRWWKDFNPKTEVINLYSQTETTGTVARFLIISDDPQADDNELVPIGKALPDLEVRLRKEDSELPTKQAEEGEIFVFGNRVAAGYLDPTYQKGAFGHLENEKGRERFYRTGDLARLDDQSNLYFTGRADRRLKIRGFRVDLGEVENALERLPGIQKSYVVPQYLNGTNEPTGLLAAYLEAPSEQVERASIKTQLKQDLPDYMIPNRVTALSSIPQTASGKIDQKALTTAILESDQERTDLVPPRNATEESLYAIWKEVLGQTSFSVLDDFFDLGGDSLSALTLITEIEKTFDRPLPLDAIFEKTTIEGFAKSLSGDPSTETSNNKPTSNSRLVRDYPVQFRKLVSLVSGRQGKRLHAESLVVTITPDNGGGKTPLFFCANGQGEAEALAEELGPDQPLYFLESGFYVISRTDGIIRALAEHHLPDILSLYPSGPYAILGYSFGCSTTMVLSELLSKENREISFLGLLDARIGPSPSYRWYFKRIDQPIARHVEVEWEKVTEARNDQGVGAAIAQTGRMTAAPFRTKPKASSTRQNTGARPNAKIVVSDEPPFQPPHYNGPIHLFRASNHWFRNLLFPRAGFPRKTYPDLTISKIEGTHHTMMTNRTYRSKNCKVILDALNQASK